jgi:hypothetical protein
MEGANRKEVYPSGAVRGAVAGGVACRCSLKVCASDQSVSMTSFLPWSKGRGRSMYRASRRAVLGCIHP